MLYALSTSVIIKQNFITEQNDFFLLLSLYGFDLLFSKRAITFFKQSY